MIQAARAVHQFGLGRRPKSSVGHEAILLTTKLAPSEDAFITRGTEFNAVSSFKANMTKCNDSNDATFCFLATRFFFSARKKNLTSKSKNLHFKFITFRFNNDNKMDYLESIPRFPTAA